MPTELVTRWYGAFLIEEGRVAGAALAPTDTASLVDRLRLRREGRLTPEEEELLRQRPPNSLICRDRRLEASGVGIPRSRPEPVDLPAPTTSTFRSILLDEAEAALAEAWEPSVHLEEAVRAQEDLDRARNLIGERLESWIARDRDGPAEGEDAAVDLAATELIEGPATVGTLEADPELVELRAKLARQYREIGALRRALDAGLESAARRRLPNLSSVVGPILAARLVAQAGGLERLARLPASTIQMLGAEGAFFDHLRRGTRPPRHGLLFLHPAIQGAGRQQRGRLARALAGKAAIAARIDHAGGPVDPSLAEAFERRSNEITAPRSGRGRRSALPLDRAAEHR